MRLFVASALVLAACASLVRADDDPRADPFDALRPSMEAQDKLFSQRKAADAVAAARSRAKDDSPDGWFLLGRALVLAAVDRAESQMPKTFNPDGPPPQLSFDADAKRMLDEAAEDFDRAKEKGGLLYAPAEYGAARVAYAKHDYDAAIAELRQALRISKGFKEAAILLAQSLWEKGSDSDAEFTLYEFLGAKPKDVQAHLLLGKYKLVKKLYAQAEPEFRAAVGVDPGNVDARRLLAGTLMNEEKFAESAEHWEMVRRAVPKDDEAYVFLFRIYHKLKNAPAATKTLEDCAREQPEGPYGAKWAKQMLEQLRADPKQWESDEKSSVEEIKKRLDSTDEKVVVQALEELRALRLEVLPRRVYEFFYDPKSTAAERLAAVRLVVDLREPQTLGVLEVMLAHPTEREPDGKVREETAHAISALPTDAIVPVLFEALGDADHEVREWAVKGIAARTGKYFRNDLSVRTADADWPAEYQLYMKWWNSTSASAAKRDATKAFGEIYAPIEKSGKARVARYALPAMDDAMEATWRVGYDVFRMLTGKSWGAESGPVLADERRRITTEARAWLADELRGKK